MNITPGDGQFSLDITVSHLERIATFFANEFHGAVELHIRNGYLDNGQTVLYVHTSVEDAVGTIDDDYIITSNGVTQL